MFQNSNDSNIGVDRSSDTNNTNDDDPNSDTSTSTNVAPASVWKYIHPSDKDQTIEVNGITFKFCAKCTCRKTGRVGFYNRTHTTSQHINSGLSKTEDEDEGDLLTSNANPFSNHSSLGNADSNLVSTDPDELVFEGAFLSSMVDDGAWMASVPTEVNELSTAIISI